MTAKSPSNDPDGALTVETALDTLIKGDDDQRYELMAALDSSPRTLRLPLRERIVQELNGRFSSNSNTIPDIRGWLVSGAAVATPEPDSVLLELLSARIDPEREPSEWVRYWSLANLGWKFPYDAPRLAERAERDPAELVRTLALAVSAKSRPDLTQRLVAVLQRIDDTHRVWAALRALQVAAVPEAAPSVVALLVRLSDASQQGTPAHATRVTLIYDALLALAAPAVMERAAPELEGALGAAGVADVVLIAVRGARRHTQQRLSRLLGAMTDRSAVITALRGFDAGNDAPLGEAVRFLLEQLGVAPGPAFKIPSGPERIEFVYRLVVSRPSQFELLETFDPTRLQQLVQTLGSVLPDPRSQPNALWRSWVATVHAARLSEDS